MKINSNLFLLFAAFFAACNSSTPKEEKPKVETFNSKELGWTIEIPTGFKSLSQNRVRENELKGKAALDSSTTEKAPSSELKHIINFQKNQFNSFTATILPYDERIDGDYLKSNQITKEAIYDAYTLQKIKVDTASFQETIAGKMFLGFSIKIYGPNGDVIMNQLLMTQLRNGYDFGININYNNEADRNTLFDALHHSKFSN